MTHDIAVAKAKRDKCAAELSKCSLDFPKEANIWERDLLWQPFSDAYKDAAAELLRLTKIEA